MLIKISARNALRNRRRSAYTVVAVAFGLMCLIVFQALKVGLHEEMVRSSVNIDSGSLQVHRRGYEPNIASILPLKNPRQVMAALEDAGADAVAPRLRSPGLVLARENSSTVLVTGVEPELEREITFIAERLTAGSYLEEGGVLVSDRLAGPLGLTVGDTLTLMAQDATGKAVVRKFPVTGLYSTALASYDLTHVYMGVGELAEFLRAPGVVTEVAAKTHTDPEALAAAVAKALANGDYQVRTWREISPDVVQLIELNDSTMELLIIIVFAIVALGIVNTMSMSVFERFHEVGVMSALGAGPRTVFTMFMLESVVLGALAAVVGSLMGIAACWYLARYGIDLTSVTAHNQYFATSHVLKAKLLWTDLVWENLLTLATATLAGVFPALKAVRLEVVEALGHV